MAIRNIIGDCVIHHIPSEDTYFVCLSLVKKRSLFINRKTSNEYEVFISLLPGVAFVRA